MDCTVLQINGIGEKVNRLTTIRVRRGINGARYAACSNDGGFIRSFDCLAEVREHWKLEIKLGMVQLIRELDKQPDLSKMEESKTVLETFLRATYGSKNGKK